MSTAMTRVAPAIIAPWITLRPTPPQPTTATVSPGLMSAVFIAAPAPVSTPQPMRAAISSGMSSGIFTAPMAGMTADSENVPVHAICMMGAPSFEKRVVPSSRPPVAMAPAPASQRKPWPCWQKKHWPHCGTHEMTTWSPTARPSTPSPTSSITPAPSWPSTIGYDAEERAVLTTERSEWQTPDAPIFTFTSPAFGASRSMSSMESGSLRPRQTAALGIGPPGVSHADEVSAASWPSFGGRVNLPAARSSRSAAFTA